MKKEDRIRIKIIVLLMVITMILALMDLRVYNYGTYFIPLGIMWYFILNICRRWYK